MADSLLMLAVQALFSGLDCIIKRDTFLNVFIEFLVCTN